MHTIICGITTSGKTTFAKHLAAHFKKNGRGVIVLDPLSDPDWDADFVFQDKAEFLKAAKASQSCALFIDESAQEVGRYAREMTWCATQSRHWGHKCHFLSQRAGAIDRTVRDQCENLVTFRVSQYDAKVLSEEFAEPKLLQISELEKYEYISCGRFRKPVKGKVTPFKKPNQKGD